MQENINQNIEGVEVQTSDVGTQPTQESASFQGYSDEQVTDLMKRRVKRSHNAFFKRYGVKNREELDELFKKTKDYDRMNNDYASLQMKNVDLAQENSFLKNNVNPERYDDIKTYFKGKGIDFNDESLLEAIKTHPEWLKQKDVVTTTIQSVGKEGGGQKNIDEKKIASKYLGVEL